MSFLDAYRQLLDTIGGSPTNTLRNTFINDAANLMKTNPSYFEVKINFSDESVPSLIVDDSSVDDVKVISLAPGYELKRGDYVEWDGSYWLVLIVDNQGDIYKRGRMEQCSSEQLKWVDDYGVIHTIPCVFYYGAKANFGTYSDKVFTMPDGRRQLTVQANEHTRKFGRDKRFMFGGNVFKIIDFDTISDNGLVHLNLKDDLFNPSRDNKELGIADYYKSEIEYKIQILNGNNIEIKQGDEVQLEVRVTLDGKTVEPSSLEYLSSNPETVSVDQSGKVTALEEGAVYITVTYKDATADILVVVHEEVISEDSIIIIESTSNTPNEIRRNQRKTYVAKHYINGVLVESSEVTWGLYADDQTSTTSLARIVEMDGNTCIVENSGSVSGYVQLYCQLLSDPETESWLKIQMKPLF